MGDFKQMYIRKMFYALIFALLMAAAVTQWGTAPVKAAQSQETIPGITKEEFNSNFVGGLYAQMHDGQYTIFTRLFTQKESLRSLPITWTLKWKGGERIGDWPAGVCDQEGLCASALDFEYTSFQGGHGWIFQFSPGEVPEWAELEIQYGGLSYTERLEKAEIRPVSDWVVFSEDDQSAKLMHNPSYPWPFVRMTRIDWSWYNTGFSHFGGGSFPIHSEPLGVEGVGFFDLVYYPEPNTPVPGFELVPHDNGSEWRKTSENRFQRYQWEVEVEHEGSWDFVMSDQLIIFKINLTNPSKMSAFYEAYLEPSSPNCWEGWEIGGATLESSQHQHVFLLLDASCSSAGTYNFEWVISEIAPPDHPHHTPTGEVRIPITVTILKGHEEKYLLFLPVTTLN